MSKDLEIQVLEKEINHSKQKNNKLRDKLDEKIIEIEEKAEKI